MVYKCKVCGGQTTIDSNNGIIICDYCGTKQALPLFTQDSERLLYESGNNYLLHNEYDKAENVFNQLLTIKPNAAELYWDLVLCKFGVTYVKDPQTGKYIPTCNRTHYTPIFSDKNYQKAIELSTGEKKALFEEDAKTIDNIQKGIIAVSKKEKPFDVFISYKETDANGNRTKDSIEAQKLYEKLTEAGYKVFFSRITLEDKIGTEYEPYIYAALYSSKVMLTVCSSKENIEAVWVKNEWSRFLSLRQNDTSKTVLPLYFDMEKYDLPDEFALLSSYDMTVDGFTEELLRGIKKLIPLPIMKAKRRKLILKTTGITLATIVLVVGIAAAIIVPKELENRRIQAEEAALVAANEEAYLSAMALFDSADYTAAEEAFKELGDYKDSAHMAERCPIQPDYDAAMKLYYDGRYAEATWAFEKLGDYEDSADQCEKSKLSWRKSLATVAMHNKKGSYYVGANGTINTFKDNPSGSVDGIDIAEHGKVISIGGQVSYDIYDKIDIESSFWTLNEDGYISNNNFEDENLKYQSDFIQISQGFDCTHIALRSDGTMVHGKLHNDTVSEKWLSPVSGWKDVVSFDTSIMTLDDGIMVYNAAIIAVKADGTVYSTMGSTFGEYKNAELTQFLNSINSAKTADIFIDPTSNDVAVSIITKDGNLIRWYDGSKQTYSAKDIVYVQTSIYGTHAYNDIVTYMLKENGDLVTAGNDNAILSDVVYINEKYAVTRSGSIYLYNQLLTGEYEPKKTEGKTRVYDEWLERLD